MSVDQPQQPPAQPHKGTNARKEVASSPFSDPRIWNEIFDDKLRELYAKAKAAEFVKTVEELKAASPLSTLSHITIPHVRVIDVSSERVYNGSHSNHVGSHSKKGSSEERMAGKYRVITIVPEHKNFPSLRVFFFDKDSTRITRIKKGDLITLRNVSFRKGRVVVNRFSIIDVEKPARIYSVDELSDLLLHANASNNSADSIYSEVNVKGRLYLGPSPSSNLNLSSNTSSDVGQSSYSDVDNVVNESKHSQQSQFYLKGKDAAFPLYLGCSLNKPLLQTTNPFEFPLPFSPVPGRNLILLCVLFNAKERSLHLTESTRVFVAKQS